MNKYLQDRAMRRRDRNMGMYDERNPYGSRRMRGRDRGMDYEHDYPEYYSGNVGGYNSQRSMPNYYNHTEQYGEHNRPMGYQMYGVGGIMPMHEQNSRYHDTRYGGMYPYDYGMNDYGMEEEYKKHLHKWMEKLKTKDRFRKEKHEIIQMARSMGAKFNNYNEDEFAAIYYMVVSDYRNELIPSPQQAVLFAIDWLEDDDVAMKGSEKVCSYLYATVLGEDD